MAEFCIKFYFPTWLDIKQKSNVSDGSKHFFNMTLRIQKFAHSEFQKIAIEVYFAHPENIVLGMLCVVKMKVCAGLLSTKFKVSEEIINHHRSLILEQQNCEASPSHGNSNSTAAERKFVSPKLNVKAKAYDQLVNLDSLDFEQ